MTKLTLPFLLIALAASAPAAPVAPPPREVLPYYPTTVGAKRVYILKYAGKEDQEHVEAVAAEPGKGGGILVKFACKTELGYLPVPGTFEVSERGLFWDWQEGLRVETPRQPLCLLKLPHRTGQTWVGYDLVGEVRMTATGPERVEVPAGAFDCVRVDYRYPQRPDITHIRWFARGVGEVKIESGGAQRELKSFTAGKGRAR